MTKAVRRAATFSAPGFRSSLGRFWDEHKELGLFIGLNPGKANAEIDDMTALKYIGFADRWGWGGYLAFNLFEYVATDPRDLVKRIIDGLPVNPPDPNGGLRRWLTSTTTVCLAWGNRPPRIRKEWESRVHEVLGMVRHSRCRIVAAKITKTGDPAHLSRLPYTDAPVEMC